MQEQLERDRVRKQRETEERLEQERIRKERELEERLESERMKREVKKEQEMEQKRREKEMEETLEREREAARRREIEADRKHQEELDRIKREQERVDKERRRNEEAIHKQKEEARKQKEQELRKQIEELKEIEREKEKQRLKDLEVIAQLEEERKQQKNDEDRQSQQSPSRNRRQSPTSRTSPTRSSSETSNDTRNTFVSKIPQLKQSPDQQRRTHSPLSHSPDQHRRTQSPLSHSSDQQLRTQSPLSHSSDQRLRTQSPLSNIPEDKLNQHSISEVNTGQHHLYTTKPLKRFLECYERVLSWLTSDVESFVSGHQDMGSGLALAKQFYELHVQFQQDLEDRKTEISSIIASIPSNIKSDLKADLDRKLSILNETYYRLAHTINSRLKLSKHYVSIHELSVNLSIEYDLLDLLLGKRQQQDQLIEDKLDKLGKMKTLFGNVCDRFFKLIEKIGDTDTRLDIERTRSCIDTLLEHFDNRNLTIDTKYHSYQLGISKIQDTKIRLMQNMADSTKTVDWVSKLDAQLYPILSEDLSSSQDVLNHIGDKYRVVLPEIRRALAEIKLRIKTAEDLLGQGQGEGLESLGEGVPPRLKELDEKLSVIVTDYQAMLDVYQTFFQNFLQLEKTISTMSSEVNQSGVSISNVEHMESMLANHEMSKQTAREMFKYVHAESIGVANKIKELEPEAGAEKDISILNRILNSQRKQLDHLYTNQELDLESKKHSIQFDADLNSIQANIDELSQKLNDIRDKSNAAQSAPAAALEFRYLETTIQLLAERIETFVTGADTLKSLEADTSHIDTELHKLKFKWNEFQNQMTHTRDALEHASTGDKGAEFCKQNRQFLSSVTMKSHLISSPQDAQDLVKEIDQYLSTRELKMQEILNNGNSSIKSELTELTEHLTSLRQDLHALTNENKAHHPESANQSEVNEAHQPESTNQSEPNEKANVNEANTPGLSETANQSEEKDSAHSESTNQSSPSQPKVHQIPIRRELDTPVHIEEIESILCPTSPTPLDNGPVVPRVPVFVEPLRNSVVEEGAKFTFKCRVAGFPTPQISWHKDGLSIENNPDYQTSFLNDEASLTIDETFAEDSAKFTCVARNSAGAAETYAFLSITECDPQEDQITAPKFSLKLENVKFKVPTTTSSPDVECQLVRLVCHVTGQPPPTVVWFKEGEEIVEEEGKYRCLLRGGEAVLEIPNAGLDTVGRYECRATNRLGSESSSALVELDSDLPAPKVLVPLPQEAMVRAGQKLKLQCEVENLAPDTKVEWLYNGIPVGDHSRDIKTFIEDSKLTLLVSEAFPKDAGTYSLTLTTPTTSIDSTCKVSVKGLLPNEASDTEVPPEDVEPVKPSIGTPLRDVSLFEGGQALLDCVIVGTPEPEVIWYHDGRPVKEAEDFQLLFKGDKCSLLIKEVFVEDGGEYRVVAINSAGEAESKCKLTVQAIGQLNEPVATRQSKVLPVAATVAPPSREEEYCLPKFSTLITDVLVREGEDAILEAVVEGNPAPRVKWTLNNKDIVYDDRVKSEFNPVDGKTSLFIGKATQQDKGLYTLRAENSLGEVKCFSHVIVKCVNSVDGASNGETQVHLSDIFEVPEFTETFSDAVVPEESPIKFECIAVGKPTPKIKWLFNNEPISGKDFLISTSGARQVLSIPSTSMGLNGGRVSCVAENEAGRTSCSAQLVVTRSLTDSLIPILTPTMSVSQLEPSSGGGGKYEMKRSAMFSSQSSFSSRVNGDNAPPGGISANSTGMTANSSGISAPFSGITPPSSGIPASFSGMTVPPGAKSEVTQFSSEKRETSQQIGNQPVSRSESETIKEYKNINGVESRNEKSTESSSSNFSELINRHEILSSGGSHGSIPALLKSSSSSSITKTGQRKSVAPRFISPLNGKIVDLGADVVLEAIIEGYPTPDVKWSKNGLPLGSIPGKVTVSFEHNKARLELKNTTTEDGGRYTVTLENTTGSAGSTADLIVKKSIFPPVMCRRLLPQSIYTGDRLVMEVEIAGTPTPSIQWFKDNYPISSQSQEYRLRQQGNSYAVIVEKATLSNSGTYKVTATNEGGEAISSADVRVTDKTVISSIPGIPSVIPFSQELQPSLLQTDNKRDYSNSSNFFKQQQQTQQQTQQREQQQQSVSSYQTQENLSVSKTLIKEDKNVNLK
uniref:Muscle M-line assembly protein unc-89 n=1 Tax=Cacopsylla melanoneura TaxID=428564 RepID=A0A8D8TU96_9HEMI